MSVAPSSATISASGMNSCDKGWYHTHGTFYNYCPNCHSSGTLTWNPKGTSEGEWTCMKCGSDFCICGKEKVSSNANYLIPYVKKKVRKVAKPKVIEPMSPLQKAKLEVLEHKNYMGVIV